MRVLTESYSRSVELEDRTITWTKNGITQTNTVRLTHVKTTRTIYRPGETGKAVNNSSPVYQQSSITLARGAVNEATYYYYSLVSTESTTSRKRAEGRNKYDHVFVMESISTTAKVIA